MCRQWLQKEKILSSHADHPTANEVGTGGGLALGKTSGRGKLDAAVAVVGLRAARLTHLMSGNYQPRDLFSASTLFAYWYVNMLIC